MRITITKVIRSLMKRVALKLEDQQLVIKSFYKDGIYIMKWPGHDCGLLHVAIANITLN